MKFTVALFIALLTPVAALGTSSVRLRGAPQPQQAHDQGRQLTEGDFSLGLIVSFILNSGAGNLTDDEQMFAKYSVRRSYNSIHDPEAAVMKFADITSVEMIPLPEGDANRNRMLVTRSMPVYTAINFATLGICRFCSKSRRRAQLTQQVADAIPAVSASAVNNNNKRNLQQTSWETAFCNELSQGPYASFEGVANCTITPYIPDTGVNEGVEDVQFGVTADFTLTSSSDLTTDEQSFVNECVRFAYNEVHDAAVAFMENADLTSQTHQSSSASSSWSLEWAAQGSFLNGTTYDDDTSSWQDIFCAKLVAGPFAVFQGAENCQITVAAVVPSM